MWQINFFVKPKLYTTISDNRFLKGCWGM